MANTDRVFTRKILLIIIFTEFLSLACYFWPQLNAVAFITITVVTLALSVYKLEYGLFFLFAELFVGSKGYLFSLNLNGLDISIRMSLWLVVMSAFLGKFILLKKPRRDFLRHLMRNSLVKYFFILFAFIAWGVLNGLGQGNGFMNVFFDANGWLFFATILPVTWVISQENDKNQADRSFIFTDKLLAVFWAALIWLCAESIILAYIFSHDFYFIRDVYHWVRNTGVGEITLVKGGFYRVFIQSQIFILPGLFLLLAERISSKLSGFKYWHGFLAAAVFLSVIIISFSRSFWAGLAVGFIIFTVFLIRQKLAWRELTKICGGIILAIFLSVLITALVVKFPLPRPTGGFNTADLLAERAGNITGEAAAASRWSLWPRLWDSIKKSPLLGEGFGATVSYETSDPRQIALGKSSYTTYAFEWGWLDIWLKIGLFGLIAYALLILNFIRIGLKSNGLGFAIAGISLVVLATVNFFTPYLNHPLGIGFLVFSYLVVDNLNGKKMPA